MTFPTEWKNPKCSKSPSSVAKVDFVIGSDWFLSLKHIEALFWPSVSSFFMFLPRTFSPYLSPYLSTYLSPFVFSVVISLTCLPILSLRWNRPIFFLPAYIIVGLPIKIPMFRLMFLPKWDVPWNGMRARLKWGFATWMYDGPLDFAVCFPLFFDLSILMSLFFLPIDLPIFLPIYLRFHRFLVLDLRTQSWFYSATETKKIRKCRSVSIMLPFSLRSLDW